jgi:8-oxo-dGTP pyrophosphatase MutT (NUDIX family)
MKLSALEQQLRVRLAGSLPGHEAQLLLSPRPRLGWTPGRVPPDTRPGAALLLLYPRDDEAYLVLTVRDSRLPHHAGQVALPGGAVEAGESIEDAALREAQEEIGVPGTEVRVVGRLSPLHIPASGYVLTAVVGIVDRRPPLRPEPGEVERILEVPLESFHDPQRLQLETRQFRGRDYEVPYFELEGEKLWGATAMVIGEFLWLLGVRPDPWRIYGSP